MLGADQINALECLVEEVERVPPVRERPVGDRAQHDVGELREVGPLRDRSQEGALGGIPVTHLGPLPEPAAEHIERDGCAVQRVAFAPRRGAGAVGGDAPDAVEQREVSLAIRQLGQDVAERDQDGHADAEAVAHARAEQSRIAQQRGFVDPGAARAEHRLGDHQAQIVRHAVVETSSPVLGRIGAEATVRRDEDLAVRDPHRRGGHIVGPQVEGAAARQVEARVMPGAGENAVPDAALVQGKAEMRAAVVQGEHAALVVHHEQRTAPALDDHATLGF